ncbi:MAG: UbiX family flavin prenyltransferase [Saprospiraceae bacterium]
MQKRKIVLGIGGSSGAIYAKRLMEKCQSRDDVTCNVVMSKNALANWKLEIGDFDPEVWKNFEFYKNDDFLAPFASGSAQYDTMIICPASMGLVGRIASGVSDSLMTRAADVMLKEKRRLIVVVRETPYNLIHLKNMTTIAEAGGIICPATPSFYSKPSDIISVVDTVIDRILDIAKLDNDAFRWGQSSNS